MSDQGTEKIIVYDIRGQICPSSLLFTLKEVNEKRAALKGGQVKIVIKTDNRNATTTVPDAVTSMGYHTTVEKKEGYYEIQIMAQKKEGPAI